jgi:cold shock CspA family protein
MPYGHITRLVAEHGFGFLVDDAGLDWFFVRDGVRGSALDDLWIDERVGFTSEWTARGPRAVDIHFEQHD